MIFNFKDFLTEKYSHSDFIRNIKQQLDKGKEGKDFFNTIDNYIKSNKDMIIKMCSDLSNDFIVSSGKFGDALYHLYEEGKIKSKGVLVFNGKILTRNKGINSYYPFDFDLENKEFIFVDDSFFSGKTMRSIEEFLIDNNSIIKYAKVAYDGSLNPNPKVKSLFRYYDNL